MNLLNGLILVDKPIGITSHDLVASLRKIYKTKEVGHCGTLDPMASGLMVALMGEATKLSNYILDGNKSYEVQFEFGKTSDTLDATGVIEETGKPLPSIVRAEEAIESLSGEFLWPIPLYSAKKIEGKKLYEYARENKEVEVPSKMMKFWGLEILLLNEKEGVVRIHCSKGSFIRSWVSELGQLLGCGALMTGLRRIGSDPFRIEQAKTLLELSAANEAVDSGAEKGVPESLIPLHEALPHIETLRVSGGDLKLLKNGQISHDLRQRLIVKSNPEKETGTFFQIHSWDEGRLVALIGNEPQKGFQIRRIFNERT